VKLGQPVTLLPRRRSDVEAPDFLAAGYRHATVRYGLSSGHSAAARRRSVAGGEDAEALVAESKAAVEASRCADAVALAHRAALLARDSMMVWYNLQITMMRCDTSGAWDFSMEAPAPPDLLPPLQPRADAHAGGECRDMVFSPLSNPSRLVSSRLVSSPLLSSPLLCSPLLPPTLLHSPLPSLPLLSSSHSPLRPSAPRYSPLYLHGAIAIAICKHSIFNSNKQYIFVNTAYSIPTNNIYL